LSEGQVGKAPEVSGFPVGLPEARKAPVQGVFVRVNGEKEQDGTWLPDPLDDHVVRRLRLLDVYPELCQRQLDRVAELKDLERQEALDVAQAQCTVNQVDSQVTLESEKTTWLQWAMVAGAVVLGGLAGYGIRAAGVR